MKFLNHFSRITSGRAFIPQIDGLRFIAIMAVVAYHVRQICSYYLPASPTRTCVQGDPVNDIFSVGHYGVALFFCLSGFILSLPFARQHLCSGKEINLREYYVRRVTRIEPPYVIHLFFLFALCALVLRHESTQLVFYQDENWLGYSLKHILASLIYMNGMIYGRHPYPNIVLWSLEIEVQFYLLAPFLARVFMIQGSWLRRGLLACSIILFTLATAQIAGLCQNPYRILYSLAGNLQYFLVGFLLADFYLSGWLTAPARNLKWDVAFIVAFATAVFLRNSHWLWVVLPFLMLICCIGAFRGKAAFQFLGYPWITTIGGMCYTIYMYHALVISSCARLTCRWQTHILWLDLLIQFIIISAVIIVLCAILFAFFERPFMRKNWPVTVWSAVRSGRKPAKAP